MRSKNPDGRAKQNYVIFFGITFAVFCKNQFKLMKKIILLACAIALFSCSDDDTNTTSLDGTWKLTYVNLNRETSDLNGDGVVSENLLEETDCMNNTNIVFTNSDTAVFGLPCPSQSLEPETVTFIRTGNTVEFSYQVQEAETSFFKRTKYALKGNTLTATFEGDSTDYVPGEGEYGDVSHFSGATFVYTKQ